jgi:hypothetical protein
MEAAQAPLFSLYSSKKCDKMKLIKLLTRCNKWAGTKKFPQNLWLLSKQCSKTS